MARGRGAGSTTYVLDSGAVIALSRRDAEARALLSAALERDADVLIPAVVVAETVRGGPRDAPVNQVIARIEVAPADETTGRIAGALLARARSTAVVDALVVAEAVRRGGAVILTGDVRDLSRLASPFPQVVMHAV